jgi:nitroimidazol reductase NimA-like FMN-containing flavoprotein (pyridoxamine 5'-phosphate oxidase superfamily)
VAEATPEIEQYLKENRLCIFATGRKDGSPQQSLIGYQFDGKQFLLSGNATSFKMRNIERNTKNVSLAIQDGRRILLVYGTAELVKDPAEMEKLQERFGPRAAPPRPQGAEGAAQTPPRPARPMGQRINILVTPTKFIAERMNG